MVLEFILQLIILFLFVAILLLLVQVEYYSVRLLELKITDKIIKEIQETEHIKEQIQKMDSKENNNNNSSLTD